MQVAEASRPEVFTNGSGTSTKDVSDLYKISNRLHQLQGWELYKRTLLGLGTLPDQPVTSIEETFTENEEL